MKEKMGTTGLIFNEPLLWEKGSPGRTGISLPRRDVDEAPLDKALTGDGPDFPDLSELDVVRHFTKLSQWNFGVDSGMYPLGSCTMKYNPKTNERQASLPGFAGAHPLLPERLSQGLLALMHDLAAYLGEITGLPAVTLQPSAGSQGELTGMLIFSAYHKHTGKPRSKVLIPDTAHGTNPASAALCGFKPVAVKSGPDGILVPEAVAALMDDDTAGIMITNPNTLGLFESNIRQVADIVHGKGGLVYGDGANMNAIMGVVNVGDLGVDVLHLNLHKTFSTPHGGGGPGAGPVCVTPALAPFLPVPRVVKDGDVFRLDENYPLSVGKVHAFYGNVGILIRAYSYILSLGKCLKQVSQYAVLNANYIKQRLKGDYHLPFDRPCMHECVFTDKFQQEHHVATLDIAKRLMDHGFHPPTIYFPLVVSGAIMIEPTESESKETLDQFIDAMQQIAREAKACPDCLHESPQFPKVRRLDETLAARSPCLKG
ncbi:putative glycine dehydrogenase (decarboxylating) subunit 2 [Desulfosarcina ovata subsp. sediminis]|uniref:glycine dehydrogenase (aminomethyl-transferring) n=1 Tax=Desulfosarcina ovata subsp. sediminis TaxID=885957 RepID=A0A5K7ZTX4_9BACT|nr:aminomethyl-transferring glycine dehydrogenase subunit GcvPB [Desulfosarcina ovata]BBO83676.1 putative glycine dehydrogenase (decarboxylating) subunit 2 [Desulfosarcina ovata subsp. sediminis]